MAKNGYRPYKSRQKTMKNMLVVIMALLLCAALYFGFRLLWKSKSQSSDTTPHNTISINQSETSPRAAIDIVPSSVVSQNNAASIAQETIIVEETAGDTKQAIEVLSSENSRDEPNAQELAPAVAAEQTQDPQDAVLNEEARKLVEEANRDIANDKIIAARTKLNTALRMPLTQIQRENIKEKLTALSDIWLFGDKVLTGDDLCSYYKVQSGDLLARIASKNNIPWELLCKINKISRPESLRAGQKIKIINGPFHAIVDRSNFTIDIYLQQTYVKSYPVGLGQMQYTTPTGMWLVKKGGKMISPSWTDPDSGRTYDATDSDYPLGKRWVALDGLSGEAKGRIGFAIHGTNEPDSIGKRSSRGCIRMHNKDVIEIYDMMMPGISQVQVKD